MKIVLVFRVLTVLVVLKAASHAYSQAAADSAMPEDLDRLIELSQLDERTQWWPAVQDLGRLARTNEALRAEIWERAKVNTLGIKFVYVEPGAFTMGPDLMNPYDIQVAHPVKVTRGYYMAVTEVTNAQFREIFPKFSVEAKYSPGPDYPAVKVSWEKADRFCALLSAREGVRYRLPTEAEWEYACRAGTTTQYCFGDNRAKLAEYGWWNYTNGRASEVALLKPNNWGIYDMHGNAFEWVSDWYSDEYYSECATKGTVEDPKGPERGFGHVLRGGAWQVRNHEALTSTARSPLSIFDRKPFARDPVGFRQTIGFRVVREVSEGDAP